ncbi:MAG: ribosome recycling factor [Bdellovibrionota bacterium]
MIDALIQNSQTQMNKSVTSFTDDLAKLRTGRATPSLLDKVMVDYYGTPTPIAQMAAINIPEARLITIQPWDATSLGEIEKAIQKSDLGLTPQNDGKILRIPLPPLTEERRKDIVKQAGKEAEEARVAVRNIRRSGMDELKSALKDKKISEDDQKKGQDKLQAITDESIKKIDTLLDKKSKEIMEV